MNSRLPSLPRRSQRYIVDDVLINVHGILNLCKVGIIRKDRALEYVHVSGVDRPICHLFRGRISPKPNPNGTDELWPPFLPVKHFLYPLQQCRWFRDRLGRNGFNGRDNVILLFGNHRWSKKKTLRDQKRGRILLRAQTEGVGILRRGVRSEISRLPTSKLSIPCFADIWRPYSQEKFFFKRVLV